MGSRPAATIPETAEAGDHHLILVTSSGRGAFERFLIDLVSKRVAVSTDRWALVMPTGNDK